MAYSKSPLAFDDCREAFDKALAAPKGIKIGCVSHSAAVKLRQRFNYFRKMDRLMSLKIYPPEAPEYGRSAYDGLTLRITSGETPVLWIEKQKVEDLSIQEIE